MRKFFFLIVYTIITAVAFSQAKPTTKQQNDSLEEIKLLMDLIDSLDKPTSYFDVSVGIGNKLFSVNNNTVNVSQAQVKKIYYTPSIAYHHKSGFGVALTPYLTIDSGAFKIYQTAFTGSYEFSPKNFNIGLSYSRYFADKKLYNSNSIYQNDIYFSAKYSKPFIQPSIALGFANGNYNEINIDSIRTIGNNYRVFKDSTNNKIKDFSLSVGIEHNFTFDKVITPSGSLSFTPQLVLNAGSEKFTLTHTNKAINNIAKRNAKIKNGLTQSGKSPFAIQSAALSLDFLYSINKFSIEPNLYVDYYIPSTTSTRLTTVFAITFGYSF